MGVIDDTGIDLADPKVGQNVLAPAIAARFGAIIPYAGALDAVRSIVTKLGSLGAMTTLGAIGAVYAAGAAAVAAFNGRVDAAYTESQKRSAAARELFVQSQYVLGDWATVIPAQGPDPSDLDIKGPASQYPSGMVWRLDKAAGKDRLVSTWSTPPYDEAGVAPDAWLGGFQWPIKSPLTGYRSDPNNNIAPRYFVDHQWPCAAIPEKYRDHYWGTGTLWKNKYDTVISETGYVPPPDYSYLFSWGTAPYLSWSTASNGEPRLARYDLSAAATAIHTAIHTLTPIHAAIDSGEVAMCYRAWLEATQLRALPPVPKKQVDFGVYLDSDRLPWSPNAYGEIWTVVPGPQGMFNNKPWSTKNPGGMVEGHPRPEGYGYAYALPASVARDIEEMFRGWFALRRAAMYQLDLATPAFREAAAKSRDSGLRKAMKSGPPPAKPWQRSDPLGDGWTPAAKVGDLPLAPPPQGAGPQGWGSPPSSGGDSSGGAGGALVIGAAAAAAWWALRRRRA